MTYFLDFDRTLFDTDRFIAHLLKRDDLAHLHQESEETLGAILNDLVLRDAVVFVRDELTQFVYPDVPEFLRMAGNEAIILTFGNPRLQELKIENALAGIPRVSALYSDTMRKGQFMRDRIMAYGSNPVFVDDRAIELEDMERHCPQVRLFEMRRDGGAGDGRWPVIRSLNELP